MLRKAFISLIITLILQACGGGDDAAPVNNDKPKDNTEPSQWVVTGPDLGSNTAVLADIRKPITFSVTNSDSRLSLNQAYATRSSTSTESVYWLVQVKNVSASDRLCFIRLNTGTFKDALGATIKTNNGTYLHGSIFKLNVETTNTCLAPGETGFFVGVELGSSHPGIYSNLAEIVFDNISVYTDIKQRPLSKVAPDLNYTVTFDVSQFISLKVSNTGTVDSSVDKNNLYVMLDQTEEPLHWGFMERTADWDGLLTVDNSNFLEGTSAISYTGKANRIRVLIDYEDSADAPGPPVPSPLTQQYGKQLNANDFSTHEAYQAYLLKRYNDRESKKVKRLSQ